MTPDDRFVLTMWHNAKPLAEVLCFAF
ncbi:DUF7684 family protein [Sphingomonas sp. RIT328]